METTPPTPETDASRGLAILMGNIGYLRQQVEAYNKRPLPATEGQVKDLIKADKERPVQVSAEKVVEQLMGKTGDVVDKFQSGYTQFNRQLENLTAALRLEMTTQAAAMQTAARAGEAAARSMQASADAVAAAGEKVKEDLPTSVPVRGEVYGFTNEKTMVWTVVSCLLLGALLYWGAATLFGPKQISKEDYAQLQVLNATIQAKSDTLRKKNNLLDEESRFYIKKIRRYVAKNKKAAVDFPAWKRVE